MLNKAKNDFHLDLESCYLIGDSPSDIEMGKRGKCKTIFIKGEKIAPAVNTDYVARDLFSAVQIICNIAKNPDS